MECIIDTNVIVDYILLDSENHARAESELRKIDRGFLPTVVVEELAHVLGHLKLNKKTIEEKLRETLSSYEVLSLGEENLIGAVKMIMKEDAASFNRFNDKAILSAAKARALPLLTFDQNLIKECEANGVKTL
jgi:predicted nucleic acid-binding protein